MQRTERLLHGALLALLGERAWNAISVQDVCERADVGRSTFYVHFADKEELLVSGFGELRTELRALAGTSRGPLAFSRALFEHARAHHPFYRALIGLRTAQVVYRSFMDVLVELIDDEVAGLAPAGLARDAAVRYMAGAFWEILRWWTERASRVTAAEVDALYRRCSTPILRELKRSAS